VIAAELGCLTDAVIAPCSSSSSSHGAGSSSGDAGCSSEVVEQDRRFLQLPAVLQTGTPDELQSAQPPAVVAHLARMLSGCQQALQSSPELLHGLRLGLQVLRFAWLLLLLQAVLHGSLGLMLVSGGAMTATTILLRLLYVLMQPALRSSLTNAAELQWQMRLLFNSVRDPLPEPHGWLLAFDSACLEQQYKQVGVPGSALHVRLTVRGSALALFFGLDSLCAGVC
jgi:hypothetical protein